MRSPLLVLLALVALGGCARVRAPDLAAVGCAEEIKKTFGDPATVVVALAAADGGSIFRPEVLSAVDRVCASFEDAATDDTLGVKCITTLPIMEGRPAGTRVVVARDEMPLDDEGARRLKGLVAQIEFARGDIVDLTGEMTTYVHLPRASFAGVDLRALFGDIAGREITTLQMAIDRGRDDERAAYRRLAKDGPSSSVVVALVDSEEAGGLKEPARLLAIQAFQRSIEALPKIAQTFSIVDDITMVRRGLRKGNPAEAIVPGRRAEVSQLLLALGMNPAATRFGPRMDSTERVGIVRVQLAAMNDEQRARTRLRIRDLLAGTLPGMRALVCDEL